MRYLSTRTKTQAIGAYLLKSTPKPRVVLNTPKTEFVCLGVGFIAPYYRILRTPRVVCLPLSYRGRKTLGKSQMKFTRGDVNSTAPRLSLDSILPLHRICGGPEATGSGQPCDMKCKFRTQGLGRPHRPFWSVEFAQ